MKSFLLPLFIIITHIVSAQTRSGIEKAYVQFESDAHLKHGLSALTVMNAQTGEVVFSKNGDIGLAPASTLKTVTAASAFQLLGADFTWQTNLSYNGTVVNGVLIGDLVVSGGGDPTFGSDRFDQSKPDLILRNWVEAIKNAGIKKINGRIIADDGLFGTQITPLGWIWQDIGNYYGAGATSLSWKENQFGLKFKPGTKTGSITTLEETADMLPKITFVNEVLTGAPGSGDNVYAYSAPYTDVVYLRGTYGSDLRKTIMISMPDPALTMVSDLQKSLTFAGISSGEITSTRRMNLVSQNYVLDLKPIATHSSPRLSQVIYWFNQKSINLYGENILKTIAWKQGKMPSTENGVAQIQKLWKAELNIDPNAIAILDGSGLSPENRITSRSIADIIRWSVKQPWFIDFQQSLPTNNAMKMKSGSIRNVLAYAGYHKSSSGNAFVFSFITNNYSGSTSVIKQKMFRTLDSLK